MSHENHRRRAAMITRAVLTAYTDVLRKMVAEVNRSINELASIHCLPVEPLSYVPQEAYFNPHPSISESWESEDLMSAIDVKGDRLQQLASVCTHWWGTTVASPPQSVMQCW